MLRLTLVTQAPTMEGLGHITILNDGTGTPDYGNYLCALVNAEGKATAHATVSHYPRHLGAWELVARTVAKLEALSAFSAWPRTPLEAPKLAP